MRYDYRVVPAPDKGDKSKNAKGAEARFAAAIERVINDMASDGWEYQRSETLPSEERSGLTQTQTVWRNLLVFRRPNAQDASALQPRMLAPPEPVQSSPAPAPQAAAPIKKRRPRPGNATPPGGQTQPDTDEPEDATGAAQTQSDRPNGSPLPDALRARAQRVRQDKG